MSKDQGRSDRPKRGEASQVTPRQARELAIFWALSDGELRQLEAISHRVVLSPGQAVFRQGEQNAHLYGVVDGSVRLSKLTPNGRRQVTGFLFRGDFLGLATAKGNSYTAEAIERAELCRFPKNDFDALIDEFPWLGHRLLDMMHDELAAAQDQMLVLGRKTAREKVATFLLELSNRANRHAPDNRIALPMSREDIADYLGLAVETVSRTLSDFRREGLIRYERAREIDLIRKQDLEYVAEM